MQTNPPALSRDQFREQVFARDGHRCVMCGNPGVDAHHILERRLWEDWGYHVDNGATLCELHHLEAEGTVISPEDIRAAAGITKIIVPDHLYPDQPYDKWGNPVLENGTRAKGELFADESVQKILAAYEMLGSFVDRIKYPRTYHLPWSPGIQKDDRVMKDLSGLENSPEVVITEKMDGENTSLYSDYTHARSVDSQNHPSRNRVKAFWGSIAHNIPNGWRICGENLYAKHSIAYHNLPAYFLGFSIWNEFNTCLGWDETLEWFALLGITPVPELYRGPFDRKKINEIWAAKNPETCEGYVIRTTGAIAFRQFRHMVGKFVRPKHVQTTKHWMRGQPITPNQLAPEARPLTKP